MQLDVQTLRFINVAVLFIAAITAVFFWRRNPQELALQEWAIATGLGGMGSLVLGVFGPVPASAGMGIIGNTLGFASFAMSWQTMRRFNGRLPRPRPVAILVLV